MRSMTPWAHVCAHKYTHTYTHTHTHARTHARTHEQRERERWGNRIRIFLRYKYCERRKFLGLFWKRKELSKKGRSANVRSKVGKRVIAIRLAFILLDLEYARIRRGAKRTGRGVDIKQLREAGRTRTIYSMKAHACNFVLDLFCWETSAGFAGEV